MKKGDKGTGKPLSEVSPRKNYLDIVKRPSRQTRANLFSSGKRLALHTTGTAALDEGVHFVGADVVEVAFHGVLQSGSCGCEFDYALRITAVQGSVDQTAAEGVAAANAVHDVQAYLVCQ